MASAQEAHSPTVLADGSRRAAPGDALLSTAQSVCIECGLCKASSAVASTSNAVGPNADVLAETAPRARNKSGTFQNVSSRLHLPASPAYAWLTVGALYSANADGVGSVSGQAGVATSCPANCRTSRSMRERWWLLAPERLAPHGPWPAPIAGGRRKASRLSG